MMKSNSKRELRLRLRFPEFRDMGAWERTQLDQLISTITPPKKIPTTEYLPAGKFQILDQGQDIISGWTNDPTSLIETDEPLLVFGDHTCVLKLVRQSFAQGADGIKIIKVGKLVATDYLYQFLCFSPVIPEEYKRHFSILKTKWIAYPKQQEGEQQKIADCLTSLDELITAQSQKLDALKAHKKGLMQQLFPREGETVPRLRFPEFREAPEWKEKMLGDIGDIVTGTTPNTAHPEYYGGKYLFVSPADISDLRFIENKKTTLSALGVEQIRPIKANSILFVCIGSTIGKIAQNSQECATNQQINSIITNPKFSDGFVYYILSNNSEKISRMAGKQAVPIIKKTLFSAIKIEFPMLSEQKRIADCLTSLDELIAAQIQKLEALKAHKKGLMQQLFPTPDEALA